MVNSLKIPLRDADDVARKDGNRGVQRVFPQAALARMLYHDRRLTGAIGRSARNGDGTQDVEPARISIGAWFFDLSNNIERLELRNSHGHFGILQVFVAEL